MSTAAHTRGSGLDILPMAVAARGRNNLTMIETLWALNVVVADLYAKYRAGMTPLLEAHGGRFGLDLWVAEVLLAPGDKPFNRVFTIAFPSSERSEAFFSNPDYLAVRKALFEPSVSAVTELGRLTRP
jgi:uncharacterized protein (DUF1330 family)